MDLGHQGAPGVCSQSMKSVYSGFELRAAVTGLLNGDAEP
jgi:hypothetical protein